MRAVDSEIPNQLQMTQDYKKYKQVKQLSLTYFLLMKKLFEAFDFNDDEAFGDDVIDAHKDDGGIAKAQFAGVINILNDTLSESEYKSIYDSDNERIFIFKKINVLRRGYSPRGRQVTKHVVIWKLFYLIQPDNNVYRLYSIDYIRSFDIDEDINIKNIHVTPKKEVSVNKDVSLLMDAIPTLYITSSSVYDQELYIKSFEQFEDFIKRIKGMGFLVKIDTNGSYPEVLQSIIDENLVDYVAMDIKNSLHKYNLTTNSNVDISKIKKSVDILLAGKIDYEFRTTVVKEYHDIEDFRLIGEMIKGAKNYFLQSFQNKDSVLSKELHSMSKNELQECLKEVQQFVINASLRGIE